MLHLTRHETERGSGKSSPPADPALLANLANTVLMPPVWPEAQPRTQSDALSKAQLSPLAALAHDARNVLAALQLCSELVSEPDVLSPGYRHYAAEVRAISQAGNQLLEQISALAHDESPRAEHSQAGRFFRNLTAGNLSAALPARLTTAREIDELLSGSLVTNLPVAVRQLLPLLTAVTGPAIHIEMETLPCPGQVRLAPEDLTRMLVNLARNAADAMPRGGHVRITVQQAGGASFLDSASGCPLPPPAALLCVQDDGPGIPADFLARIFDSGFTTRSGDARPGDLRPSGPPRRGFGLAIVRSLVESAGGSVRILSKPGAGTRFEIELPLALASPLTNVTPVPVPEPLLLVEGGRQ